MKSLYSGIALLALTATTAFADSNDPILKQHLGERCTGIYRIHLPHSTKNEPTSDSNANIMMRFMSGDSIIDQYNNPILVTSNGLWTKDSFNQIKHFEIGKYQTINDTEKKYTPPTLSEDLGLVVDKIRKCRYNLIVN